MLNKDENNFESKIKYFESSYNTMMGRLTFLCVIQIKGLLASLLILFQS